MKRIAAYILLLALAVLAPVKNVDVADLRPIEVIALYKEGTAVILESDTEDIGKGISVMDALLDMKRTSPAVIYLDTAEYLLVADNTQQEATELRQALKGSVQMCMIDERIDLQEAAKYLPVHGDLPALCDWKQGDVLPILTMENGRLNLSENSEK